MRKIHLGWTVLLVILVMTGCNDLLLSPNRAPASIELLPDTLVITDGDERQLDIRVLDEAGQPLPDVPDWAMPRWKVFSEQALTVDNGIAQATQPGETSVEATLAEHRASNTVLVNPRRMSVTAVTYVTQATQRIEGGVPLVSGRPGLLRVLVAADTINFFQMSATATFYTPSSGPHTVELQRPERGVPTAVDRGRLVESWNAVIPGELLEPGTEMVVRIDTDDTLPLRSNSTTRIPDNGRRELTVRQVPDFALRYVPVRLTQDETVGQLDPNDPRVFSRPIYDQFPLSQMSVEVRDSPWVSDVDLSTEEGWSSLLSEIRFLRRQEGQGAYYYGIVGSGGADIGGMGYIGYPASVGVDYSPGTAAHEIGHNVSLLHAPCGDVSSYDPDYPHANGAIGEYGYSRSQDTVYSETTADLMSYCHPTWISPYHYMKAWTYRDRNDWNRDHTSEVATHKDSVLVVWGSVGPNSMRLNPAFWLKGSVIRPDSSGPHIVEGRDESGQSLFSLSFVGDKVDHAAKGEKHFLFQLPLSQSTYERLHSIELQGPDGTVVRNRSPAPWLRRKSAVRTGGKSDSVYWAADQYEVALIRDRGTGDLLGIDRDGIIPDFTRPIDVILSDGVHSYRETVR